MDVTPEFEQLPTEVFRQFKAKGDRLSWIDAYPIGRIGVNYGRLAPELKFHLREEGGDKLMGHLILITQLQRDVLTRRPGAANFPSGRSP